MRLIFAGTPEFAAVALRELVHAGHEVRLVLTQPDRPSGRGLRAQHSMVKQVAIELGLEIMQPKTLRDIALQDQLSAIPADAWVVAAYGLILPDALLRVPALGCLNIHASLLPRWRGAAPIQRALMAGDAETGISIMSMDAGLDTGPVYRRQATPIDLTDTAGTLHDRLAQMGADMIVEVLASLATKREEPVAQPVEGVTYAAKIDRRDTRVSWARPAAQIERLLRAMDPTPGATARLGDADIKLWRAALGRNQAGAVPGTVLAVGAQGIEVACEDRALVLTELQRAGGRRLPSAEFLRGFPVRPGARFAE